MRHRTGVGGGLLGVMLAVAALAGASAGAAPARQALVTPTDTVAPVALLGGGTEGALPSMNAWGDALFGAPAPVNAKYFAQGSVLGLQNYSLGKLDFFVSGLQPTPSEQSTLATSSHGLIAIPIQADATGFLAVSNPVAPNPAPPLAPGLHATPVPSGTEIDLYAGDSDYYLEQYFNTAQPAAWASCLQASGYPASLVSESWPAGGNCQFVTGAAGGGSGSGAESGVDPVLDAFAASTAGGCCAAVPPWAILDAASQLPASNWELAQIPNAAGDWVAPTTATVQAALVAGGGKPLSALTSPEPGGYPLSWVDDLYAPAGGLSVEKTNALATLIRYAVTSGAAVAPSTGTIPLPGGLVSQALQGADDLVRSNCSGAGVALVSTTDPGPYAPSPHALDAVGPRLTCEQLSTGSAATAGGPPGPPPQTAPGSSTPSPSAPAAASSPPARTPAAGAMPAAPSGSGLAQGPGLFPLALGSQTIPAGTANTALSPVDAAPMAPDAAPVLLLYGLPHSASRRTDAPVTFLLGALMPWLGYRGYRRRRRRKLGV